MTETAPAEDHAAAEAPSAPAVAARGDTGIVRAMKVLVIVLGVLLILGFFTVVARLVYLAARPGSPAKVAPPAPPGANASLELPTGANVRTVTLSGDRLAVHYDAPSGGGIAVIDIASGRTLARIQLHGPTAPAAP